MPASRKPRIAVFPASFDPLTRGHLDVIERARGLFDRLVVGVLSNPDKENLFPLEERLGLVRAAVDHLEGIEVRSFSGLAVDFAASVGADWIVRGVRSAADVAYELPMAHSNRLCGREEVDTVLIPTRPDLAFISSSLVRQIAAGGGRLEPFVPPAVEQALRARLGR